MSLLKWMAAFAALSAVAYSGMYYWLELFFARPVFAVAALVLLPLGGLAAWRIRRAVKRWLPVFAPLVTLGCFCVLGSYSYARYAPSPSRHHVGQPALEVRLWKAGPKLLLARKQAEVLAKVYGITDANIDSYKEWW